MAKYTGGMQVGSGYYWHPGKWEIEVVPEEGGKLRGATDAAYVKVPFPLLFVIVPLLGALFLMFLPAIGFGLAVYALARKITGGVKRSATELASTMAPGGFATGEAHFTGKPGEEKKEGEAPRTAEMAKLEKEIEARKGEKK